ncbi:MAG: site-specific DNA-methyltransferase [Candidatus Lokiarchaeota archaeon]|nr:site-specific DNA-methyltransferase [Candidatus Lokiarchaeota archaeon]
MEFDISNYLINFSLKKNLDSFLDNSQKTQVDAFKIKNKSIKKYINEFWTSKQRQASSIHEISYRACFKAQLPRFFLKLLTKPDDVIYDPFSGRGTTIIEAGLLKRKVISNDINPLSEILARPRLNIPSINDVKDKLDRIPLNSKFENEIDLSMFYHEKTEREILSLKNYLYERKESIEEDDIDRWIRMVATNRLTGHSIGFFSVYTLPPNQAVSPKRQIKINRKRRQKPEYRGVKERIIKKSISLLRKLTMQQKNYLKEISKSAIFLTKDARNTPEINENLVQLTVTSPPFLKVVQYLKDNWLRFWFNSINAEVISKKITMESDVNRWSKMMGSVFKELYRITKINGWVAFEVGEIQKGKIKLEDYIVPEGLNAGFVCKGIVINEQDFTKTSNIWGIKNKESGTNTNRIVLFKKEV